ncbi:MAG: hypothetical protein RIG84_04560 [Roseovarius sp.]
MRLICLACLTVLALAAPFAAGAQELKAMPVDEAGENTEFAAYRDVLLAAVVKRDVEAVLSMASEDVRLSFGGDGGQAALRAFLEVDPESFEPARRHEAPAMRERNWADLETVLRMGGRFDGAERFIAPYTFGAEMPEGVDPFEVMYVTGSGVALRDRPIRFADVVGRLDHDVVRQVDWVSGTAYVEVALADGTQGFVHGEYLRAPVDYRAIFERREGAWKLVAFVAGE